MAVHAGKNFNTQQQSSYGGDSMAKKKREEPQEEPENHERWLLTYSDMITLLLGLFIMLYAMSNVDKDKYAQVATAMSNAFGASGSKIIQQAESGNTIINDFPMPSKSPSGQSETGNKNGGNQKTEQQMMDDLAQRIQKYVSEKGLRSQIKVDNLERGVVIRVESSYFFQSGSDSISVGTRKKIDDIGVYLKNLPNYIRVEGHTDNVPISNKKYDTNWNLSTARATKVVNVLTKDLKFNQSRLAAVGYGETRPIAPNNNAANKAKNRRVEIVVVRSRYREIESGK